MSKKDIFRDIVIKSIRKQRVNNYKKDKVLVEKLYRYIVKNSFESVMLYIPLQTEVDIMPLIKRLRAKGVQLYVPFMVDKSFRLVKYRLPLQIKKFGIKEPKISKLKIREIDLAIVPIIGIDKDFKRVGFGKGMYDRFFEKNSKYIKHTIFIQRDLYVCSSIVTNSYDISADGIFANSIKYIEI
jgi:5-formyltetrahydrofolate cyclo-ligase